MKFDKVELTKKIKEAENLSNEDKSSLIELLNQHKKYGLVWEEHEEDAWKKLKEFMPVLKEVPEKRIDGRKGPNHILIEGDNLFALESLLYTHAGKIDVIYIDPPYNTGNKDFIYNDSFIGEDDSYRHSKWLSFMGKRLRIAKALLSEKGVIFISIDDNEQADLKLLCDEVFGANGFVGNIIWQSRTSISNDDYISTNHNHTLIYSKNRDIITFYGEKLSMDGYINPDNDPRGPWKLVPIDANHPGGDTVYGIVNPNTGIEYFPPTNRIWAYSRQGIQKLIDDNRIKFGINDDSSPKKKLFYYERIEKGDTKTPSSILLNAQTTKDGTNELISILGSKKFDYPKPSEFIKRMLTYSSLYSKEHLILDFFAGSGTTLHATMQLNSEDGGHRQCILVTNNENGICENVTYERNKRVIEGYTTPKGESVPGLKNNNLRYFKVGFTPREKTEQNMLGLAIKSISMLCIKNDIYKEVPQLGNIENSRKGYRYFKEGDRQMLVILDTDMIGDIVEELEQMDVKTPIPTYVYSAGHYPFTEDFDSVSDKIDLYPIPYSIYGACEKGMPAMVDKELEQPEDIELTEEEENMSIEDYKTE